MSTNLEIDENLIKEAIELGGHPSRDAVVMTLDGISLEFG